MRAFSTPEESPSLGSGSQLYLSGSHPIYGTEGVGQLPADTSRPLDPETVCHQNCLCLIGRAARQAVTQLACSMGTRFLIIM